MRLRAAGWTKFGTCWVAFGATSVSGASVPDRGWIRACGYGVVGPVGETAFEGRTKWFVSLFQVGREHIFDPFHECADSARQVAPMRYYEGHGKRPATEAG